MNDKKSDISKSEITIQIIEQLYREIKVLKEQVKNNCDEIAQISAQLENTQR